MPRGTEGQTIMFNIIIIRNISFLDLIILCKNTQNNPVPVLKHRILAFWIIFGSHGPQTCHDYLSHYKNKALMTPIYLEMR